MTTLKGDSTYTQKNLSLSMDVRCRSGINCLSLKKPVSTAVILMAILFVPVGCNYVLRNLLPPDQALALDKRSPNLKIHMKNGSIYVLKNWKVDPEGKTVRGEGSLLDANRKVVGKGAFTVSIDSVAIFETNVVQIPPSIATMTIVTMGSAVLTIMCLTNPKACFGSCPTLYVSGEAGEILQAEGFSDSISRILESRDVDALYRVKLSTRELKVRMKNEALETHVVRSVNILATPHTKNGRVLLTETGEFYQAEILFELNKCIAPEGDCLDAMRTFDGREWFSTTDPNNLAIRETITVEFDTVPEGNLGLVIASRHTLLSTFLFYQTLAYMGRYAGHWMASLERGVPGVKERTLAILQALGGIEVLVQDNTGTWISAGEVNNPGPLAPGPLATVVKHVPLPGPLGAPARIQLRLTRGHWRLDYLALATIGEKVEPIRLEPLAVFHDGHEDPIAKGLLTDPTRVLTTMPGDEYTLLYRLPKDFNRYEFFLESQGYYIEWIREEWLKEENLYRAWMMGRHPHKALRILAPEFKKVEAQMESLFWRSRYVRR